MTVVVAVLPTEACDPGGGAPTVHEDKHGRARAIFVLNPTEVDCVARVSLPLPPGSSCHDVLDGTTHHPPGNLLEVRLPPKTVRFFSVEDV